MKSTLSNLVIFVAGAAVGGFVTWRVLKPYYEKLAQEEIDSVKETYANRFDEEEFDEDAKERYVGLVTPYISEEETPEPDPEVTDMKPRVISPDEFGTDESWDTITLHFHADGVLTDELGELVEDVEGTVGCDSLKTFGLYEDDCVHVANDELSTYYEILFIDEDYYDQIGLHLAEGE